MGWSVRSMSESSRRTSISIGLIAELHGCDETVLHGEYVENFAIGKDISLKAPDDLVHPDADLASAFVGD